MGLDPLQPHLARAKFTSEASSDQKLKPNTPEGIRDPCWDQPRPPKWLQVHQPISHTAEQHQVDAARGHKHDELTSSYPAIKAPHSSYSSLP